MKRKFRIVFMGTPDFAVESLQAIVNNGFDVTAVITAPDKPSGRGKKILPSAVKRYAMAENLKLMQPLNLKDEEFLECLQSLNANLFVVVAFRMLPKLIWSMPEYGTFNLHASLLPDYRGAAPINWAIINGEQATGLTTFFLNDRIDTGDIIFKEPVAIKDDETFGELHDRLKVIGAALILKTLQAISENRVEAIAQNDVNLPAGQLHPAPKIHKEDTWINWNSRVEKIHDLVRGLSPIPAAITEIIAPSGQVHSLKVFKTEFEYRPHHLKPGMIETDGKSFLNIAGNDGLIKVIEIQLAGKKRMGINDFLRGFPVDSHWKMQI